MMLLKIIADGLRMVKDVVGRWSLSSKSIKPVSVEIECGRVYMTLRYVLEQST